MDVGYAEQGWIGAPQREMSQTVGAPGYGDRGTASIHYYDPKGRPTLNLNQADGKYFYTATSYDDYSRPKSVRYFWRPAGDEDPNTPYYWNDWGYAYTYDAKSYLTKLTDSAGRIWWEAAPATGYDHLDRPVTVRKGNGHWTSRTYRDTDGLLTAIQTGPTPGATAIQNLTFAYDGLGNLTGRTVAAAGGPAESFTYDSLNRLRNSSIGGDTAYELNGNITAKKGVDGTASGAYAYSATKPHAVSSAFGNTYTYDANGNLLTRTGSGGTWSTKWAGFDKPRWLINATTGKGEEFTYNANRSRLVHLSIDKASSADSSATPAHYTRKKVYGLGPQLEADYANTAATAAPVWKLDKVRIYVPGPEGTIGTMEFNPRAPFANATTALVYHYDHLGSIERLTPYGSAATTDALDGAGKPSRYSYDAWGQRRNPDTWTGKIPVDANGKATTTADGGAEDATPRGFTGHEMLDDIGLVHMNGRIYDPLLGRFLSADTVVQFPGNLQSFNRYSYVQNNPLTFKDDTGHFINFVIGAVIGGGIDLAAQVFIEGKSLKQVNYASVGISAAAGATGVGLGGVVANASKSLATTAIKQVAIRAGGNMVAGAVVGTAQTAATNAVSDKSEQKSLLTGALLGAAGGAAGSLAGDVAEAAANKLGNAATKVAADALVDQKALQTKLIQGGTLQVTGSLSGDLSTAAAAAGEVVGSLTGEVPGVVSTIVESAEPPPAQEVLPSQEPAPSQEPPPQEEEPPPAEPIQLPDVILHRK